MDLTSFYLTYEELKPVVKREKGILDGSFYLTYEERKIRLTRKPADFFSGFCHRLNTLRSGVFPFLPAAMR
jgi:hypothetical protein